MFCSAIQENHKNCRLVDSQGGILHQCGKEYEHYYSSIGKHFCDSRCFIPKDLSKNFSVLEKCKNKVDCLVTEMSLIKELRPSLNVQSDSIHAKVFKMARVEKPF